MAYKSTSVDTDGRLEGEINQAKRLMGRATKLLRDSYCQDQDAMPDEVRKFRHEAYSECVMYGNEVFPKTVDFIGDVADLLDYYIFLEYEQFANQIADIREQCRDRSKLAARILRYHSFVVANFKRMQDELQKKVAELSAKRENLERKIEISRNLENGLRTMTALGASSMAIDFGLGYVLCCGLAAGTTLAAESVAIYQKRLDDAVATVRGFILLGECMEWLANAINSLGQLLSMIEHDLDQIERTGKGQKFKTAHWMVMRGKASRLVESCRGFIMIMPDIKSDIQAIQDYVDESQKLAWRRRLSMYEQVEQLEIN
ncbi:hypothetical protein V1525DRAFT_65768 [Lipomyces kononenkoae]|uniref:Uncharacterized protein n=1 Tax=Lipomyces kononenkoae TaxID=34357 RepID=A0ACC3SUC3_LIPKO